MYAKNLDRVRMKWAMPLLAAIALAVVWAGCLPESGSPRAGLREYEAEAVVGVRDFRVHLAGGNVSTDRIDLVLDTRVGPLEHGAVFNSATRGWVWRHEMNLQGGVFVDESGAELDLASVGVGAAVPGTHWVRLDGSRVKTKGGLVHEFDPSSGRLTEVRWLDSPFPVLRYVGGEVAGAMRTVHVDQCVDDETCSTQLVLRYDEFGCVASATDRSGRVADYIHDASCRTLIARDADDVERGLTGRTYDYGPGGQMHGVASSEGEVTRLGYTRGRLTTINQLGAEAVTHRFEYIAMAGTPGIQSLVTLPLGGVWRYIFDDERRLVRRESPEGDATEWTWSGLRPDSLTDATGSIWRMTYIEDDLSRVETPAGEAVHWFWASEGVDRVRPRSRPLARIEDSLGTREQRVYDDDGRMVERANGAGEVTSFTWDALGQLSTITSPAGRTTSYFDRGEHGHPSRVAFGGHDEFRLYDAVGNLEKGDGLNGELGAGRPGLVRRRFDADRNVAEIVTVETSLTGSVIFEKSTLIERRSDGRPLRIITPYGGDEHFIYDSHGRLVERRERADGVDRVTTIDVDLEGHTTHVRRPNGMEASFGWDREGRLVTVERWQGAGQRERVTFSRFAGQVIRIDDGAHVAPETIEYDVDGRVSSIDHATGGRSQFRYDARGRVAKRSVFDGTYGLPAFEVTRTWDGAGRVSSARLDDELLVERTYVAGELTTERTGSGLTRSFTYDPVHGQLAGALTVRDDGEVVEDSRVGRAPCWSNWLCIEVWSAVWLGGGEGVAPLRNIGEEVHALEWHPAVEGGWPNPGPWLRLTGRYPFLSSPNGDRMQFDALGNLVAYEPANGDAMPFEFNAEHNRLVSGGIADTHDYVYDEAGFVNQRDGVPLTWTPSGRLASVGDDVHMQWDAMGRPRSRTLEGETTQYGFGGAVEVDEQGWPIATEIEGVRVLLGTQVRRHTHRDYRGNVLFVTDEHGRAIRRHVYGGFGERWVVDADGTTRPPRTGERGFAGGLHLAGIQLLGARPYDPDAGRFLAPDPIDHVLNDFSYTRGNPVTLWDPGGTQAAPAGMSQIQATGSTYVTAGEIVAVTGGAIVATGLATGQPLVVVGGLVVSGTGLFIIRHGYNLQVVDPSGSAVCSCEPTEAVLENTSELNGSGSCSPTSFRPRRFPRLQVAAILIGLAVLAVSSAAGRVRE